MSAANLLPPQAQWDKDREQLAKSGSPAQLNTLRRKNQGNKYPDLTLLPPFDLPAWLYQPKARVHKESLDVVCIGHFPRARRKG